MNEETNLEKLQQLETKKADLIKYLETEDIISFVFYAYCNSYETVDGLPIMHGSKFIHSPNNTYSLGMIELLKSLLINDMLNVPKETK